MQIRIFQSRRRSRRGGGIGERNTIDSRDVSPFGINPAKLLLRYKYLLLYTRPVSITQRTLSRGRNSARFRSRVIARDALLKTKVGIRSRGGDFRRGIVFEKFPLSRDAKTEYCYAAHWPKWNWSVVLSSIENRLWRSILNFTTNRFGADFLCRSVWYE